MSETAAETLELFYAAQCKLYDERKTLQPDEIEVEVEAAKEFPFRLGIYAICTTAKVSTQTQDAVTAINQRHLQEGLFKVELFTWDRLEQLLEESPDIRDNLYLTISGEAVRQMQSGQYEIRERLTHLAAQFVSSPRKSSFAPCGAGLFCYFLPGLTPRSEF